MHIWIINLKPKGFSDENVKNYCFENELATMGWRLSNENLTMDEYKKEAGQMWTSDIKAFSLACDNYHKMQKDDICLASNGSTYYIGRVEDDEPFYAKVSKYDKAIEYKMSWCRRVKWFKIGRQDDTPSIIVGKLSSRHQKTIDIRYDNSKNHKLYVFCKLVYNTVSHTDFYELEEPIQMDCHNFANCLSDQDLEDLVGLYLQEKFGYLFYPSSCKKATKEIEYILLEKDSKKPIYAQVKQNATIDIQNFSIDKYENSIVYLFSDKGYENQEFISEHIQLLNKEELFEFFKRNIPIFQKRLQYELQVYQI